MAECVAIFEGDRKKYEADFKRLLDWLVHDGLPLTTASLDFGTVLKYVGYLKSKPAVGGVWR